jgi:hypothetical protein
MQENNCCLSEEPLPRKQEIVNLLIDIVNASMARHYLMRESDKVSKDTSLTENERIMAIDDQWKEIIENENAQHSAINRLYEMLDLPKFYSPLDRILLIVAIAEHEVRIADNEWRASSRISEHHNLLQVIEKIVAARDALALAEELSADAVRLFHDL